MNCGGCVHFSPLADPEFADLEEFTRDVKRMGELFSHECEWIHLMGGEPLLHPNVIEFMKVTRSEFPKGKIELVTNGLLLMQQSKDFWQACHDFSITIGVSHYPIKLDINGITSIAENFGVQIHWYGSELDLESGKSLDSFFKFTIDLTGSQNVRSNFARCDYSNVCIFLRHGKLYTCSFAGNVHHFNKKFGAKVSITDDDYIDIYKQNDPEAILQRLSEPIPICRYCSLKKRVSVPWRISKREMSEWV